MDRYIKFTWESPLKAFVKDAKEKVWEAEIKKKMKELDAITDLSAISNSEVHTQNVSSPTESTALKRMKIEHEISRRMNYRKIFDTALNCLTEDEREIFEGFWLNKRYVSSFVDDYANRHDCSTRHVYFLKNEVDKQFCMNVLMQISK